MASDPKGHSNENGESYMNSFVSFISGDKKKEDPIAVVTPESNGRLNEYRKMSDGEKNGLEVSEAVIVESPAAMQNDDSAEHTNVSVFGNQDKPKRETYRRAAVQNKIPYSVVNDDEDDEKEADDPDSDSDYQLSDSDNDPDFTPVVRKDYVEFEDIAKPKRGRGRGRGFRGSRGRGIKRPIELPSPSLQKRRGRPPKFLSEKPAEEQEKAVTVMPDVIPQSASKLSSAFNYSGTTARQNTPIRLPEGPQLTEEQLRHVESQFHSGDFVMAKKDVDCLDNPPIWRIDGKSLLQKFQAFEKDGKILYRNISTYSGWTSSAKALYTGVKVTFVFQSRYDTVVQLLGFKDPSEHLILKPDVDKTESRISEELMAHMSSFEIYLQTLISQALDNNFLQEIYEENDTYFVDRVKIIDDLTELRKQHLVQLCSWNEKFQKCLDLWPCVNVMTNKSTASLCEACGKDVPSKLSQFYGQPHDNKTLRSKEPSSSEVDSKCKATVTSMRASHPDKSTTTILRDLLANDQWILGLFRSMCSTWVKIDQLCEMEKDGKGENAQETSKEEKQEKLVEIKDISEVHIEEDSEVLIKEEVEEQLENDQACQSEDNL